MKIGILYICTGKYKIFWKDFYLSCEKNFIPDAAKEYFVFTDAESVDFENENPRIHRIYQKNLGWPGNTLKRYDVFLSAEDGFSECDYLIYFNANLLFLRRITVQEFLPGPKENFIACIHPGYYNKDRREFTYERRQKSMAGMEKDEGKFYFAGGINGGRTREFVAAMRTLRDNIMRDEQNGILAVWHDESHWNKFLSKRDDIKILTPAYLYPEGWMLPYEKIVLVRDKKSVGGHARMRGKFELRLMLNEFKRAAAILSKKLKCTHVIKIHGGLGNQMFQYAFGRRLELSGKKVVFDVSAYHGGVKNEIDRKFELSDFRLQTIAPFSPRKHIVRDFIKKVLSKFNLADSGFYQSEKYFVSICEHIKREFVLNYKLSSYAEELERLIADCNSVSVHIRRGDYVSDKKTAAYHGVCGLDYYQRAFDLIKMKISNPKFYIFSDDIDWVKNNFVGSEYVYASQGDMRDTEELVLMAACKHNIIANSSFSWWAAWLNSNPGKIVVAPKKWFNNPHADSKKIIPVTWIKI